jgi:sugar lactone lactonase YvrE
MRELVATPCTEERYELGESCRWDAVRQELSWVDVYAGSFFRARADGSRVDILRRYDLGGHVTVSAPLHNRRQGWILGRNQSIVALSEEGELRELAAPEAARPDVRMNDGAADPWGTFWIGSMAYDKHHGGASLYRFDEDGQVHVVVESVTISNGIAWSADRSTMYYIDTPTGCVVAFDLDERGWPMGRRTVVQLDPEREGHPDGMCVDVQGDLWVALFNGSEVRHYSSNGELLARVAVPTPQVSSCAIGGANGTTLYITTGQEEMTEAQRVADPLAGRLFCVDVGVSAPPILPFGADL